MTALKDADLIVLGRADQVSAKTRTDLKEHIQEQMMTYAGKFYNIVSDARGIPLPVLELSGITSGRTFIGDEALRVNLVDSMKSFDQTILKAYSLANSYLDKNRQGSLSYTRN
jgi:ClpP class serine protease